MKINQVCKELNLTKKAILYYEKQGLIKVQRDANGYRMFDDSHIYQLKEITLYRKLDISMCQINDILKSQSKGDLLKSIDNRKMIKERERVKQQTILRSLSNTQISHDVIDKVLKEVSELEMNDQNFIINRLKEYFPGGLGLIISIHFSGFMFDKIESLDQNKAWLNLVSYLESLQSFEVSDTVLAILNEMDQASLQKIHHQMKEDVIENRLSKESLTTMKNTKNSVDETSRTQCPNIHESLKIFNDDLNKLFKSDDYKVHVIENIKRLSNEYRLYHDQLMAAEYM